MVIGHPHALRRLPQGKAVTHAVTVEQLLVFEKSADLATLRGIQQIAQRGIAATAQFQQRDLFGGRRRPQVLARSLSQPQRAAQRPHHQPSQRWPRDDALAVVQQAVQRGKSATRCQLGIFHRELLQCIPEKVTTRRPGRLDIG